MTHFERELTRRTFIKSSGTLLAGLGLAGTGLGSDARAALRDGGDTRLRVARNISRRRGVVEVVLVARPRRVTLRPGTHVNLWTYNGLLPGPLIEAKRGDRLVVHLLNRLPEATTIHWHGVEVPATMDGSNISQAPVPPGGRYRYEFDLLTPALYWYHPHVSSNEQVERGLAGALVVYDDDEDSALGRAELAYHSSQVLVLDDLLLDAHRSVAPFATDPDAAVAPLDRAAEQLNGREGNVLLVNGRVAPTLNLRVGVPQRWRIVNTANARFMRLSVPGHILHRVGGDGGLLTHPLALDPIETVVDSKGRVVSDPDPGNGLLLVPGERADIVFTPTGRPGTELPVQWHDFPRGRHHVMRNADGSIGVGHAHDDGARQPLDLFRIRLLGGARRHRAAHPYVPPRELRSVERLDPTGAPRLTVPFGHTPPDAAGNVTFFNATKMVMTPEGTAMKGVPFAMLTSADAPDVVAGETYVWEAVNMTGGDHPFHPHGFFFQPLEIEYVDMDHPAANRIVPFPSVENKDTIRVPARPGAAGRSRTILRGVVRFDDHGRTGRIAAEGGSPTPHRSGGWLAHCHMLEHADRGMMMFFEVRYPAAP